MKDVLYLLFKGEKKKAKLLFQTMLIIKFIRLFNSKKI